jgi:hypothetical protein
MATTELTHEIMRKLTSELSKVDTSKLKHYERIQIVAEVFGWRGDALMHYLKTKNSATQDKDHPPSRHQDNPLTGRVVLFAGASAATRTGCLCYRAKTESKRLNVDNYGALDTRKTFRYLDKRVPKGVVITTLQTQDDWNDIAALANFGHAVYVDSGTSSIEILLHALPMLVNAEAELQMIDEIEVVSEELQLGFDPYKSKIIKHPFLKAV